MRVLMVTRETGEDRRYGLGKSLTPLFGPLKAAGVDVRYFCQEDLGSAALSRRQRWIERLSRLPMIRGRGDRLNLMRAWAERLHVGLAAARLAAAERYTHVHAHDPWLACGVALGLRWYAPGKIHWGLTQHGFGSYSHATHEDGLEQGVRTQAWMRRVERTITARADWVTAPTAASLAQLARDLGLPRTPVHWHRVPHARPVLAPVDAEARQRARAALGWSGEELVVLAVGRLVPLKCFDRVVRACAAQSTPRIRLLLLGTGELAALHDLAHSIGFGAQLRIEATHDVELYFHAADIYMSASSTESFGMANLEALCAGLPAICSAVGGVPEVAGDGAWLMSNDVETLARALGALVANAQWREMWARRGLERAAQWPTAQEVAERYVAIYQAA
jgi:glycosyltransferase involved in cell wall biosynthesis